MFKRDKRYRLFYRATLNEVEHDLFISSENGRLTKQDAEVMAHYIRAWWEQMLALGDSLPLTGMPRSVEDLLKGLEESEC